MQSNIPFIKNYFKKLSFGLVGLITLFALAVFLFVFVIHEVLWEKEQETDVYIFNFISGHLINPQLTAVMKVITQFAAALFLKIAYSVLVSFYLASRNYIRAVEIAAIGIGGFLVTYFMKLSFHRVRPVDPMIDPLPNFSFPSGHATSGFIFYGLLVYLIWKTNLSKTVRYISATLLVSFSVLIGFSRVYLRVHFASDVLAGFCVGFAWLLLSIALFECLKKKSDIEIQQ